MMVLCNRSLGRLSPHLLQVAVFAVTLLFTCISDTVLHTMVTEYDNGNEVHVHGAPAIVRQGTETAAASTESGALLVPPPNVMNSTLVPIQAFREYVTQHSNAQLELELTSCLKQQQDAATYLSHRKFLLADYSCVSFASWQSNALETAGAFQPCLWLESEF